MGPISISGTERCKRWRNDRLQQVAVSPVRRLAREMRPLLGEAGKAVRLRDDSAFRGVGYTERMFGILEQLNR